MEYFTTTAKRRSLGKANGWKSPRSLSPLLQATSWTTAGGLITLLLALSACSDTTTHKKTGLYLDNAYIKTVVPGRSMTAAYATLINHDPNTLCLEAFSAPFAQSIELHVTEPIGDPDSGQVRMRRLPKLCLEPGDQTQLAPGGMHLMVMGVTGLSGADVKSAAEDEEKEQEAVTVPIVLGTTDGRAFEGRFLVLPFNK